MLTQKRFEIETKLDKEFRLACVKSDMRQKDGLATALALFVKHCEKGNGHSKKGRRVKKYQRK